MHASFNYHENVRKISLAALIHTRAYTHQVMTAADWREKCVLHAWWHIYKHLVVESGSMSSAGSRLAAGAGWSWWTCAALLQTASGSYCSSLFRNVTFRIVYASIESLQSLRKYTKFLTPCSTKRNTHLHGTITQIIWKTHSKKWWYQVSLLM